ncbi:alanine dehydrogenase [Antrihabitans cavernicola]|uniref:Alanine dehydrogenase n=1 Tax=Antrihabitans cavernicola TaxID=2495913 RepID=A0A5A7SCF6_9NOCA|nr:alanine dehydrogenase [Spelaeibacter cavernicola]KAA0023049.1 alanine dehydrogenase [Spelaeibacter cavernicola]
MKVGVPREIKDQEFRVALTPAGAHELTAHGHDVLVETSAGAGSGFEDADYTAVGARIVDTADEVWDQAELLLKVKEPIAQEYSRMRRDQVLFTYLHLAASKECTDAILDSGTTAIAYEMVEGKNGSLPLLAPMSEVAGKLATQCGAYHLMRAGGGAGVLMGGVPGVRPANVVVIGAGVAGTNAATVAVGMGAQVTILDLNIARLREVDEMFGGRVTTVTSNKFELERAVLDADLVIGSVLVPGARAPKLVSNSLVARMKPGSVLVDIAIDQGGCFEASHATTHSDPTYRVADSVFYCVANMPGAVPNTSTYALTNATLPYVLKLADQGWRKATAADPGFANGLSAHDGQLFSAAVAEAHGYPMAGHLRAS